MSSHFAYTKNSDFIVTSLRDVGFIRPIQSPILPTFGSDLVYGMASRTLLEQSGSVQLSEDQERALTILANIAGPVAGQVEFVNDLLRAFVVGQRVQYESTNDLNRDKFIPSLLLESLQKTMDICKDFTIHNPGESAYCLEVQRIIFLRFVLWCFSRNSFNSGYESSHLVSITYKDVVVRVPFFALSSAGYVVSDEDYCLLPSVLGFCGVRSSTISLVLQSLCSLCRHKGAIFTR